MWEMLFDEKEIHQTLCDIPWTRSAVNARNVFDGKDIQQTSWSEPWIECDKRFWRKGNSSDIMFPTMNSMLHEMWKTFLTRKNPSDIMGCTMNSKCCKCDKRFLTRKKFNKHYVIYHELDVAWNVKNFFDEKKWWNTLCYNMCKMWETFIDEKEFYQTSWAVPWYRMQLKVILNVSMNCNFIKKWINIILASGEKLKWIREDILQNSMKQCMSWILVKSDFKRIHEL